MSRSKVSSAAAFLLTHRSTKKGDKSARHTQERADDAVLCPVQRAASLIERACCLVPEFLGSAAISACSHEACHCKGLATLQLASGFLGSQLQRTCAKLGGKHVFRFNRVDIGTKSVQSGAAMGLSLADHSAKRMTLMGRWLSQAFLARTWPQVMEWTSIASQDMICHHSLAGPG